jgi:putative ABC transport system permease protein
MSILLTYLGLELRHRMRQAIFIAAGLAVGVGLVITVSAAATGVRNAQAGVLHGLYGIGTDITVTLPYSLSDTDPGKENHQIIAGEKGFEYLDVANQGLFSASAAASIAALPQVRAAAGVLALNRTTPGTYSGPPDPSDPGLGLPVSTSVDAVDTADQQLGPLSEIRLSSGRSLSAADADADVALMDSGYAAAHHLHVGSVIALAHHAVRVVGIFIAADAQGQEAGTEYTQPDASVPDILIPLGAGQALSGLRGEVTTVYVAVASAADVTAVAREISARLPWANVTTSASLASEISGSLGTTAKLATDLGRWLAIAVLAAAFALAALLTVASVSRRVREFGTLKALGWRARRITAQIVAESAVIGLAGAVAGTMLGYAAAALLSRVASSLTATVAASPGRTEPHGFVGGSCLNPSRCGSAHFYHQLTDPGTYSSLPVHFAAPVSPGVALLAVALGLAGALLAGALGGWRAARMRPAAALVRVG